MQRKGGRGGPSNSLARMPATDDEIREKYLERAIRELNGLTREVQACELCPRGSLAPVLASGHPQADIFLLKHSATPAEIHEGVAFYGRSGQAVLKSLRRLGIDPLVVYGTLAVKCPVPDGLLSAPECRAHVRMELAIVQPRIVVAMGGPALVALNELDIPLSRQVEPKPGEIQELTPTSALLYVPDIDAALDDERAKREFWQAFRALGDWYAELPPY
jgi:uracil-DNA glycosylase